MGLKCLILKHHYERGPDFCISLQYMHIDYVLGTNWQLTCVAMGMRAVARAISKKEKDEDINNLRERMATEAYQEFLLKDAARFLDSKVIVARG